MSLAAFVAATGFSTVLAQPDPDFLERQNVVETARRLEKAPLDPAAAEGRERALAWVADTKTLTVKLCDGPLGGLDDSDRYSAVAFVPYALSMAAFIIERPDKARDLPAQQLAGVEGALKAYRAALREEPAVRSKKLDALVSRQERGTLADFVFKAAAKC